MNPKVETSQILESLNRGLYIEKIWTYQPTNNLAAMTDRVLLLVVEHNRNQYANFDKSEERRQILQIVQSAAESRGFKFECQCGNRGHRRQGKKVYCRNCVPGVIRSNIENLHRSPAY